MPIALFFVLLLMIGNLRGVKESGALFAGPTFAFIGLIVFMIFFGFFIALTKGTEAIQVPSSKDVIEPVQTFTLFLLMRAFASGCAAMTGVEAIANGVQAFREPVSKNAGKTLTWMAGILLLLFLGIKLARGHCRSPRGRDRDGHQPDISSALWHGAALLSDFVRHYGHPRCGRQHELR